MNEIEINLRVNRVTVESKDPDRWLAELEQTLGKDVVVEFDAPPTVRVKLLRPTAHAPRYMTDGAAGADVFADLGGAAFLIVQPRTTAKVPLGIALEIPRGYFGMLKGRSGLAARGHEAHVAAVDSDYRGEVCMLIHAGVEPLRIEHGDRVGQVLFLPVAKAIIEVAETLSNTERGQGGFGHTGVR